MLGIVDAQREAFFAELPVSLAVRRDRLRRALALIDQNSDLICEAIAADHPHQSTASALATEIAPAVAALQDAIRNVGSWMRRSGSAGPLTRLLQRDDYIDYQPLGVVGVVAPATLTVLQIGGVLASILAAGNRAILRFDPSTPALQHLFADLLSEYFDPLELAIVTDENSEFFALPFDKLVMNDAKMEAGEYEALERISIERSGKSPVIIGRSANFSKAAPEVIQGKLVRSGRVPLTPDYLLVPAQHEEEIANWLWRSAMHLHPRLSTQVDVDMPMGGAERARLQRLIDDARARGGDILIADQPHHHAQAGIRTMPLHIIRHASDDMAVMQQEIRGPILPLRNYQSMDEAIGVIHRHAPPLAIYYFGRDESERREVLARTISSAIAVEGRTLTLEKDRVHQAGPAMALSRGHGGSGFRSFSRARRVHRGPLVDIAGWLGDGLGQAAPALR